MSGLMVTFTPREASELTGLPERRLRDWRRAGIFVPQTVEEEPGTGLPSFRFYAFRDLVGLRALALLRARNVPLAELRKVQPWLSQHEERPWTELRLVANDRTICLDPPAAGAHARCAPTPGGSVIEFATLVEELGQAVERSWQRRPEQIGQVVRTRGVLGGQWRLAGTRIPTAGVWSFLEAGYDVDAILEQYPRLTPEDVRAAIAHEQRLRAEQATRRKMRAA